MSTSDETIAAAMYEDLVTFRDLLTPSLTNTDIQTCTNSFLTSILQARRSDLDNAVDLVCTYFEFRKKNPSLFTNLTASELRYALEDGFPCVLPYTDSEEATIMVLNPGSWDTDTFDVETIIKTLVLSLEHLSTIRHVRETGIVLLVDFTGWTTIHTAKLNIGNLRKVVAVFQECFPIWFKNVHMINQPWYVHAFITVLKPFMKDNIQDRIIVHGNNMSTLHDYIPPSNLPAEFGGNKCEVDQRYWANILVEAEKKNRRKESTIKIGINPFELVGLDGSEPGETELLMSITT